MRRVAFAFLCACAFALLGFNAGPAKAGDDYDGYRPRHGKVWYSSSCCYKKVVRHERSVRYVRVDDYDNGYSEGRRYNRWRRHQRFDDHYRGSSYRTYRYADFDRPYYRRYRAADDAPRYRNAGYDDDGYCRWRRAPIADGRGGWVWGARRVCY